MGKVRAKTIGDEEQELKEKQETEARRLAKIAEEKAKGQAKKSKAESVKGETVEEEQSPVIPSSNEESQSTNNEAPVEDLDSSPAKQDQNDTPVAEVASETPKEERDETTKSKEEKPTEETAEAKPAKKKKQKVGKAKERSEKYKTAAKQIEKNKSYSLAEALDLLDKTHLAKFDETVELHINTLGPVSGSTTLPHGTGKQVRVAILAPTTDPKAADDLLKEIESGKINFDILLATPDAMPKLAKVARILGPKGLMPNPKNGTVTPKPDEVAKQYAGGHMTFKTESKAPVLHVSVGKLSFGKEKLTENIKTLLKAVESKNMKTAVLKSTMSPAIRLQVK